MLRPPGSAEPRYYIDFSSICQIWKCLFHERAYARLAPRYGETHHTQAGAHYLAALGVDGFR